ncbi:MAG TPA: hypothetical protein VGK06_01720 [Methanosarcina sp.]|jgi:hypothetical protein
MIALTLEKGLYHYTFYENILKIRIARQEFLDLPEFSELQNLVKISKKRFTKKNDMSRINPASF